MTTRAGRRTSGGLTTKTGTFTDAAGRKVPYTYWQASREVPADRLPEGRARMRITGNGSTKAEAMERLEENWAAFLTQGTSRRGRKRPTSTRSTNPTVNELYREWMENHIEVTMSTQMSQKYANHFQLHVLPHIGSVRVRDLSPRRMRLLIYEQVANKTRPDGKNVMTTSGLYNVYYAVSAFLTWALRNDYIAAHPLRAVDAPVRRRRVDNVDKASEQIRGLLAELRDDKDPDYCRWLLQLLGLRRGERLGLRWSDITNLNTSKATLRVAGQLMRDAATGEFGHVPPKTPSGVREILLVEPFLTALREHKKHQDKLRKRKTWNPDPQFADFVFLSDDGDFIRHNQDNREWHRLLEKHGLESWRGHLMRSITATWLAALQPPPPIATVREILGHASDAMTLYYTKVTLEQQREPLTRYGENLMSRRR